MSDRTLITTDICAKEFARMHYPKTEERLNSLYNQGLIMFKDMSKFSVDERSQSLDTFARHSLLPMVVGSLAQP